jgi:hypothetical protein
MYTSILNALGANDLQGGFHPADYNTLYYDTPDYIVFGGLELRARAIDTHNKAING